MSLIIPAFKYKDSYLAAVCEGTNVTGLTRINKPQEATSFDKLVKNKVTEAKIVFRTSLKRLPHHLKEESNVLCYPMIL